MKLYIKLKDAWCNVALTQRQNLNPKLLDWWDCLCLSLYVCAVQVLFFWREREMWASKRSVLDSLLTLYIYCCCIPSFVLKENKTVLNLREEAKTMKLSTTHTSEMIPGQTCKIHLSENFLVNQESWFPNITALANSTFATLRTTSRFSSPKSPNKIQFRITEKGCKHWRQIIRLKLSLI